MGERVAQIVTGRVLDYVALDDGFVLVELIAPPAMVGTTLGESNIRQEHGVTVVCRKSVGGSFAYVTADMVVKHGDLLLIAGTTAATRRFADSVRQA